MRRTTAALTAAIALAASPTVAHSFEAPTTSVQAVSVQAASTADEDVENAADETEDSFDWGWLGLLGLLGLAGLAGRNKRETAVHTTDRDYRTTTGTTGASRTDVNRDGRADHRDITDRDGDGRIG